MSLAYLKRLGEEALYAAGAAFTAGMLTGGLDKAGLAAGLVAAGRAVLGLLAKRFGDRERPSVL
jgi:hypothetical protein